MLRIVQHKIVKIYSEALCYKNVTTCSKGINIFILENLSSHMGSADFCPATENSTRFWSLLASLGHMNPWAETFFWLHGVGELLSFFLQYSRWSRQTLAVQKWASFWGFVFFVPYIFCRVQGY